MLPECYFLGADHGKAAGGHHSFHSWPWSLASSYWRELCQAPGKTCLTLSQELGWGHAGELYPAHAGLLTASTHSILVCSGSDTSASAVPAQLRGNPLFWVWLPNPLCILTSFLNNNKRITINILIVFGTIQVFYSMPTAFYQLLKLTVVISSTVQYLKY